MHKKNLYLGLLISGMAVVACSDMGVDESEAFGFPSDYSLAEYLTINPDIKYQQVKKDLADNQYYNVDRFDSANNSYMVAEGDDSVFVIAPARPENSNFAKEARAKASADIQADNKNFLSDTALVKEVFLVYLGLADSLWKGADSLDKDMRNALCQFNKQQKGAPNSAEDRAFLENFKYNETLFEKHYLLLGSMEGRAYRFCTASDSRSAGIASVVPDTITDNSATMLDYRAFRFCYDSTSAQKYLIQ